MSVLSSSRGKVLVVSVKKRRCRMRRASAVAVFALSLLVSGPVYGASFHGPDGDPGGDGNFQALLHGPDGDPGGDGNFHGPDGDPGGDGN